MPVRQTLTEAERALAVIATTEPLSYNGQGYVCIYAQCSGSEWSDAPHGDGCPWVVLNRQPETARLVADLLDEREREKVQQREAECAAQRVRDLAEAERLRAKWETA